MKESQTLLLYVAFLCSVFLTHTNCEAADDNRSESLKLVQIIFRHGDRHWDTYYESGDGLLTHVGKNQEFKLGLYFRERYNGLISKDYQESQVQIISSGVSRCIQSSQLVTYGLYKEFHEDANWSQQEKIQFEPIPFRTIPKKSDNVLQLSSDCPRNKLIYDTRKDEMALEFFKRNKETIEFYSENSGDESILDENIKAGKRLGELIAFQEKLFYNNSHGLPVADWSLTLLNNSEFVSLKTELSRYVNKNEERKRLLSGPMIELLTENMEKQQDTENLLKLILFSAHDKTILSLQIALNIDDVQNPDMPNFAAAMMIEFHKNESLDPEPYIEIWYRNDTNKEPLLLEIPNCGVPCTLEKFKELTEYLIPEDFEKECQLQTENKTSKFLLAAKAKYLGHTEDKFTAVIIGVISVATGLLLVMFLVIKISWGEKSPSASEYISF